MGKGTNFSGQPVLSQLIKLMDRQKINTLASKSGADLTEGQAPCEADQHLCYQPG